VRRPIDPVHPPDVRRARHLLGVDVRTVVEYGITPKVTTGILDAKAGTGQVGAGVAEAPLACFPAALLDLDTRLSDV
jgi:hypothetical protein